VVVSLECVLKKLAMCFDTYMLNVHIIQCFSVLNVQTNLGS